MKTIDECKSLKEIALMRREAYQVEKANRNNFEDILVNIYKKSVHFVYELLQNADDALATEVKFELRDDGLVFYHNGSKDFSLNDIISITGIGDSTKKDTNDVGKFGVGFKSVFAITDTPLIYNRAYCFKIENFIVPSEIEESNLCGYTTKFVLPFNKEKPQKTNEELIQQISGELEGLDCATIMFLRNISSIKIDDMGVESERTLNREQLDNYEVIQDLTDENYYLVFKNKDSKISFSFLVKDDEIEPLENLCIYSFLPTTTKSALPFYVDAPFKLATTRESIDFDSSENKLILDEIAEYYRKVILMLRDEQFIKQDFLNDLLPIDINLCNESELYNRLYLQTKELLQNEKLIPTKNEKYIKATDGVLPHNNEMMQLSSYSKPWLDINARHTHIRKFLIDEIEVEKVSILDFSKYLVNHNVLKRKNNDWLVRYYALCNQCDKSRHYNDYWYAESELEKLRELPIIKTRGGTFERAYLNNEPQVYKFISGLPSERIISGLFTSKKLSDEQAKTIDDFLDNMEIMDCTASQYVKNAILDKWEEFPFNERLEHFQTISYLYNNLHDHQKTELLRIVSQYSIIPFVKDGVLDWSNGNELMRGTSDQRLLFEGYAFLEESFWSDIVVDEDNHRNSTKEFCLALGVTESLPITTLRADGWYYGKTVEDDILEKYKLEKEKLPRWWYQEKRTVDNFEEKIQKLDSEEKVSAFVRLLALAKKEETVDVIAGTIQNGRKAHETRKIPASYIRVLDSIAWIPADSKTITTRDITRDDFVAKFDLTGDEPFLEQMTFRTSFYDIATKEEQRAIAMMKGLSEEQKQKLEDLAQKWAKENSQEKDISEDHSNFNDGEADIDLSDIPENLTEDEDFVLDSDFSIREGKSGFGSNSNGSDSSSRKCHSKNNSDKSSKNNSDAYKKAVGAKIEKQVYDKLKEKYPDCDVFLYGGNNEGYDIAISKDGENIKYIEVKSIEEDNGRIPFTTSEWRKAKMEGSKYEIYIVDRSTGEYKPIKNPFQKYLDDKIELVVDGIIYRK